MTAAAQADIAQSGADLVLQQVDKQRKLDAMQLQVYADAYGLAGVPQMPPLRGPTTINIAPPQTAAPAAPAVSAVLPSAPSPGGVAGLLSNPLVAGAIGAIGVPGLLAGGYLLKGLMNPAAPAVSANQPVNTTPATPDPGQVNFKIGIGTDGKLYIPSAPVPPPAE